MVAFTVAALFWIRRCKKRFGQGVVAVIGLRKLTQGAWIKSA
jgi:hypothetical protein